MSTDKNSLIINLPVLIPSLLTVMTCPWLFAKYAQKGWERTGFSMIFILILADFLYSLTVLATIFEPLVSLSTYYRFSFYFCSHFSIYWACAIAFLLYKTLTSKNAINVKKIFIQTLLIVLALTLIFTLLIYRKPTQSQILIIGTYTPLLCGILLALMFYMKSIAFLRSQSEFQQGLINLYIKNLRYYCFTQFVLNLPAIIYILGMSKVLTTEFSSTENIICMYGEALSSLAGFVNSLIFLKQGKIKDYQTPPQEQLIDSSQDL